MKIKFFNEQQELYVTEILADCVDVDAYCTRCEVVETEWIRGAAGRLDDAFVKTISDEVLAEIDSIIGYTALLTDIEIRMPFCPFVYAPVSHTALLRLSKYYKSSHYKIITHYDCTDDSCLIIFIPNRAVIRKKHKENNKVLMFIRYVDPSETTIYNVYDDVAQGYKFYQSKHAEADTLDLEYKWVPEHVLEDYRAVWYSAGEDYCSTNFVLDFIWYELCK